jgi:hypothetical protein
VIGFATPIKEINDPTDGYLIVHIQKELQQAGNGREPM